MRRKKSPDTKHPANTDFHLRWKEKLLTDAQLKWHGGSGNFTLLHRIISQKKRFVNTFFKKNCFFQKKKHNSFFIAVGYH